MAAETQAVIQTVRKWKEKQMKKKAILKQSSPWPKQRLKAGNDKDSTLDLLQSCDYLVKVIKTSERLRNNIISLNLTFDRKRFCETCLKLCQTSGDLQVETQTQSLQTREQPQQSPSGAP